MPCSNERKITDLKCTVHLFFYALGQKNRNSITNVKDTQSSHKERQIHSTTLTDDF